jgi:hypothetical protein
MKSAVLTAVGIAYYMAGVVLAAAAMPTLFDEIPIRLSPRVALVVAAVLCVAMGALLRMVSRGRTISRICVASLGIAASVVASVVAQVWLAVALAVLCLVALVSIGAIPMRIPHHGQS